MKQLIQPQEIEVYYIIPALRKELALAMKENKSQREIAKIFGVTESAVSQYCKEKKAQQIQFDEEFKEEIRKSAKKIEIQLDYIRETQKLLRLAHEKRLICQFHAQFSTLPEGCKDCHCYYGE